MSSNCKRCPSDEAQMTLTDSAKGTSEALCLSCYFKALAPAEAKAAAAPRPAPVKPSGFVFKSADEARERADKVWFYLHQRSLVRGDTVNGYTLSFDTPLVPGFKGENPYASVAKRG